MDCPQLVPSQLRCTPYSTYYSSFFLLRTSVEINGQPAVFDYCTSGELTNGQPAVFDYCTSGELTINCRYPRFTVRFPSIYPELETVLRKYGVSHVGNFYCEDVPLFQVSFPSEYTLRQFVQKRMKIQSELEILFSTALSGSQGGATPTPSGRTVVQAELFLVSPDVQTKEARIVSVVENNCSTCMTLWKESEQFNFGALFRVYRLDPSKFPGGGTVTLREFLTEMREVIDWFHLGVHLGVKEAKLQAIKYTHERSRNLEESKSDLFSAWETTNEPTWSAVVRALVGIGMMSLAKKLAMKYVQLKKFESAIQEAQSKLDSMKQKLNEISDYLEEEKKRKADVRSLMKDSRRNISANRAKLARECPEWRQQIEDLETKKQELYYLQQQQKEHQEDEQLKAVIQNKELEIEKLLKPIAKLDNEITTAIQENRSLHKVIEGKVEELEETSFRVKELEKDRCHMESRLDWQKRRLELLMLSTTSKSMQAYSAQTQLSFAREQAQSALRERETHQQAVTEKDKEIEKLSHRVQDLESRRMLAGEEALEDVDLVDELINEVADLKVQVAEAKGEREKMRGSMEIMLEQQKQLHSWMEDLRKMTSPVDPVRAGLDAQVSIKRPCATPQVTASKSLMEAYNRQVSEEPTKVLQGLCSPRYIAKGEKMVVTQDRRLSVYNRDAEQLQSVSVVQSGCKKYNINPTGVAIDKIGNIYIADFDADRVFKLNSNLAVEKSVGGIGKAQGQFDDPRGVALSLDGTKLFVCDAWNHRIQVLDTDLRVLGCFGSRGCGEGQLAFPLDIACDSTGNVFITDAWKDCIQVFSQDGVFQRTICLHSGSATGKLSYPIGVHVHHNLLYVSEGLNRRVSMFTISGEFITCFGGRHLKWPRGIAADKDGVLFVCDYDDCTVVKFENVCAVPTV